MLFVATDTDLMHGHVVAIEIRLMATIHHVPVGTGDLKQALYKVVLHLLGVMYNQLMVLGRPSCTRHHLSQSLSACVQAGL